MSEQFATVAELSVLMGESFEDTDPRLILALEAATATIQAYTQQQIAQATDTVTVQPSRWDWTIVLPQMPVTAVTVTENDEVLTEDDDYIWSTAGIVRRRGRRLDAWVGPKVVIEYTHGYEEIPAGIRHVCLALASRMMRSPVPATSESIMSYSVSYGGESPTAFAPEEKAVLDFYRG